MITYYNEERYKSHIVSTSSGANIYTPREERSVINRGYTQQNNICVKEKLGQRALFEEVQTT